MAQEVAGDFVAHKLGVKQTVKIDKEKILMQTQIEKFKGNVKLQIAQLSTQELSFWTLAPAILKILLESVETIAPVMDLSDEKQRQFLVVATEELLEEIDIPQIDNDLEEYIDKQIVKQMPMILEKLLPPKKVA